MKKCYKLILLVIFTVTSLLFSNTLKAQTTLVAGDIAFTGYNSNDNGSLPNEFSFVLLTNISAGTTIRFTDNGYKIAGTNALGTAEGTIVWTSTTAMPRFTNIRIGIDQTGSSVTVLSAGSIAGGFSNFILGAGGDQVLAYQGSAASPTFISGIHMNADNATSTSAGWENMPIGTTLTSNRSDIPPGLTNGTNAIMVVVSPSTASSEKDNAKYNCTNSNDQSTVALLRSAINNIANWNSQDITAYDLTAVCTFGIVTSPTVSSVNSSTTNGTYKVGDAISIQVNFSASVTVTGTPQLTLETGSTDRTIDYVSGSGTAALTFTYTIQAGDVSADLDYTSTSALALNGGTIKNGSNNASLTLATPGAAGSLGVNKAIVIDGVVPTVSSVNSSTVNGTYKVGDAISIQVNFSENVTVTGTPQLTLETGTTDRTINYTSGTGTSALTFTYTVQAGDVSADLDYTSTTALALNSGTIKDAAGNGATLTLATPGAAGSLGANKAIVIDGVAPTVSSVNSSTTNGSYKIGDAISIQVNFQENVTVTGTPQLTLETGTTDRTINYTSGTGTSALTFTYTVQAGDVSADLDYTSTTALALNSGTIKDAAGNGATLTLATPGAAGSLGANKAIVIDGVVPTVTITSSTVTNGSTTTTSPIFFTATFSEAVQNFVSSDISATNGTIGNFNSVNSAQYTFQVTPTAAGAVTVSIAAAVATDLTGNNNTASSTYSLTYDAILAVKLTSFTAKPEGNLVRLDWTTESENNNKIFIVLRSSDKTNFSQLGTLDGHGTTAARNSYVFRDRSPLSATSYYKLVQVDQDGVTTELDTKAVSFRLSNESQVLLFPNPASAQVTVKFAGKATKIELIDLHGRVIESVKINPTTEQYTFDIAKQAPGSYLIKIYNEAGVSVVRFVKI